jgi:hypothetical protein
VLELETGKKKFLTYDQKVIHQGRWDCHGHLPRMRKTVIKFSVGNIRERTVWKPLRADDRLKLRCILKQIIKMWIRFTSICLRAGTSD